MANVEVEKNGAVMRWVTFRLGAEKYGINVMQVQEILRVSEITPVPGAYADVLGIINLRGNVVTVFDTRSRFGLMPKTLDDASRIIIIEAETNVIGFLVDSVAEVVEIRNAEIEAAPSAGHGETSKYVQGVTVRDSELLILVDFSKFLGESSHTGLDLL